MSGTPTPGSGRSPEPQFPEMFDYIVVGAGSAGSVVANRLSADGSRSVLLLEAGGKDKGQGVTVPAAFSETFRSEFDWDYATTAQPGLRDRSIYWPRGKVLGGSSSINALMWVVGFAEDYDRWGELAGPEWSWTEISRALDRVEVSVEHQRDPSDYTAAFLRAVSEAGYRVEDANADAPDGFTQTMVTERRGARSSTATVYLRPAELRPNLTVRTEAHTARVRFDGTRAVGVDYLHDGRQCSVGARREVVLCGGAVNTPQLLMLSGIGDPRHLAQHGIETVVDSPEVGQNMRDHLVSLFAVATEAGTLFDATSLPQLARYLTRRRGMLTSNVAEAYGFVRSRPDLAAPDLEIIYAPVAYVNEGLTGIPEHGLTMGPILLQPESRGEITLASADPLVKPVIDPRYLTDAGGRDRATMLAGLEICSRIFDAPSLRSRRSGRFIVPAGGEKMTVEQRCEEALTGASHTLYHPTSTARMGTDEASVVDPHLRVRGVQGLRVADASVMPEIIRGHTNAPSIAIGEKAAEFILGDR
nr:GMC family oxidoreductase N-terminal domain-containing protein [Corynebacterium glyciniphilum]